MATSPGKESAETRKAQVIASLDVFTRRDLVAQPPGDAEKLGDNIGVGGTNLDRFIRPWINKRFRVPDGSERLPPGAITTDTTFKALCAFAGVK